MRKTLLLSSLLIWSFQIMATQSVRLRTDTTLVVSGTVAPSTIPMNVDAPSGDGTSETAPGKLYFPIENTTGAINSHLYFINPVASVFNVTDASHLASIPLRINANAGATYLWAAVKDTTNSNLYKPIKSFGVVSASAQSDVLFNFAPADICTAIPSECSVLLPTSTSETEKIFTVYFFLSTQSTYGATDTINPATLNTGIYFQMFMSNRVYSDADLRITINKIRVGDKRLVLEYSASATLSTSTAKSVKVFRHNGAPAAVNMPVASYLGSGSFLSTDYSYKQTSEIEVADLQNAISYTLSVAFVDKYNFATTLSAAVTETPLEIQELLKKNQCYLLTAGFGEDHYVITYFRHFRDTVLENSYLGRKFVHFYYSTAPKYAVIIYKHEFIRATIRGAAYVLYFVFNYIYIVAFVFIGVIGVIIYRNRSRFALILLFRENL
ncbi:MAG: hypothetical protein H7336_02165 [Bacteriovorax sp.]|nr:hypothetical protein [Bacteriovorax sp.]